MCFAINLILVTYICDNRHHSIQIYISEIIINNYIKASYNHESHTLTVSHCCELLFITTDFK